MSAFDGGLATRCIGPDIRINVEYAGIGVEPKDRLLACPARRASSLAPNDRAGRMPAPNHAGCLTSELRPNRSVIGWLLSLAHVALDPGTDTLRCQLLPGEDRINP